MRYFTLSQKKKLLLASTSLSLHLNIDPNVTILSRNRTKLHFSAPSLHCVVQGVRLLRTSAPIVPLAK